MRLGIDLSLVGAGLGGSANMPQVYIDPATGVASGSGTVGSPYNTAAAIAWLATLSSNINRRIRINQGTTFIGKIAISGYNYIIETYGSGAKPLISNHIDISALTWTADDGVRGGPTADTWFMAVSGGASNWVGGNTAVVHTDSGTWRQCEMRDNYADLVGALYQCTETAYPSGYPFLQWWDTTTSPNRMWVRGPPGWNPNNVTVVRPNADGTTGGYAMYLAAASSVTVSDIDLQCGSAHNFSCMLVGGLTLARVDSYNAGMVGGDAFNPTGTSKAVRGTNLTMTACRAWRARNNGLEISWLDGVDVDLEAYNTIGNAVEFWESNSNVLIRRLKAKQNASMATFWDGSEGVLSHHDHIRFQNFECVQRPSYAKHGTGGSGEAGGSGIVFSPFANNKKIVSDVHVFNGSMDLDGGFGFYSFIDSVTGLGDNVVTIKNNIIRQSQLTNSNNQGLYVGSIDATANTWVMDKNIWQFGSAIAWKVGAASSFTTLAAYKAGWVTAGVANEVNSLNPAASALLFSVPAGTVQTTDVSLINQLVVAVDAGVVDATYTPTTDILGVTRSTADIGAYEYVIGSDSTPSFSPADFTDVINQTPSATVTSAAITITGIDRSATITVSQASGDAYDINGSGSFVNTSGTVYNGYTIRAQLTAHASNSTAKTVTVTIGGVAVTFTATTSAPSGYDHITDNTLDDGVWTQYTSTFNTAGDMAALNVGPGYDQIPAVSFPNVAIANLGGAGTITSATLSYYVSVASGLVTFTIHGENPLASPTRWTDAHNPDGATSIGNVAGQPTTAGAKSVDVKTIVQAMLNDADWASGDPINFWWLLSGAGTASIAGVGSANAKARLVIVL